MRGDTSEPLVDAGLNGSADVELTARAANAATLVEAQRLVTDLAALPGVGSAEIGRIDTFDGDVDALTLRLPIGLAAWCHELRVRFDDRSAYDFLEHSAKEIAAAAERGLSRPCRPVPAPAMPVPPLYQAITFGARAVGLPPTSAAQWRWYGGWRRKQNCDRQPREGSAPADGWESLDAQAQTQSMSVRTQ